jgi:hypothetical protein
MIRIAAMLSKITKVTEGFAEQLSGNAYFHIEEGILNITDQILIAVNQDDSIDTSDGLLERLPVSLAKQEMAAQAESS